MSLRALIEIAVHLESFRNIDLFYQGIYYTRLRLYTKKEGPRTPNKKSNRQSTTLDKVEEQQIEYAQPYCSFVSHVQEEKNMKT